MAIPMCALIRATLPLLLVSTYAAVVQQTRRGGLRYQRASGRQPDAAEQEALTREDIIQQDAPHRIAEVASMPPPAMAALPQQMQLSQQEQMLQMQQMQQMQQIGQQQQVGVPQMQAQQLLQAQAMQMQQMQQQLQQQHNELQRLQQQEKQHQQQAPQHPPNSQPRRQQKQEPKTIHAATPTPKKSLVSVNAQVMTKSELESGTAGIAKPKGWDQCLKFARFVKTQDVTGLELVRVWKSTCEPAVQSGRATERYKLMCNSLSGVVEPYAAQIDYDVEQLCDSVLAVFHDVTAVDARR